MSRLNELIEEFCPNGVEYRRLEEVCKITKGEQLNKTKFISSGEYPVINGGIDPSGYYNKYNKIENTITISQGGANAGYVNYIKTKFWSNAHCYTVDSVEDFMEYKYIYYFLKNSEYTLMNSQYGAGIPALSMKTLGKLEIPVPPLEIQEEIVRILDNFTELTKELTSNLTKELEARKIQYEYYRDELLKNSFEFTNFKLGNIAKFKYGYTDKAKDAGNVRFIRITDITEEGKLNPSNPKYIELSEENKEYLVNKGDLLMARTGATYGKTLYVETDKPAIYDSFLIKIILDNDLILNRYYWHFSKSTIFWEQAEKLATKGDQLQFNTNVLQNIKIPIPKIEIQKKIVDVLDNFELICSDLNIGLPAEIEARQKQYEFYRDALLEYAYTGEIIHTERETGRQAIIRLIQYVFGSVKVKLSDIANIQRGGNFAKKDFISEGIPCIHYGQIYTKYGIQIDKTISYISKETSDKAKMANKDDIIMAVTSENLEDVCKCLVWLGDDDVAVGGHTAIIKTSQNSKYLAYYLHTSMFFSQKRRLAHGTKVLEVTPNKLKDIEIPLPKLEQQEKIVTILDNFNNLINDISEGIPAEIEARQKQYEYYRDKLLSFK